VKKSYPLPEPQPVTKAGSEIKIIIFRIRAQMQMFSFKPKAVFTKNGIASFPRDYNRF